VAAKRQACRTASPQNNRSSDGSGCFGLKGKADRSTEHRT